MESTGERRTLPVALTRRTWTQTDPRGFGAAQDLIDAEADGFVLRKVMRSQHRGLHESKPERLDDWKGYL